MSNEIDRRYRNRRPRRRPQQPKQPTRLSDAAAAAERASAGIGTGDFEPTDWLFGSSLRKSKSGR
ncbi:MAG: hypothetical protein ACRDLQ_12240 [Solirubrobacterales bacterium]